MVSLAPRSAAPPPPSPLTLPHADSYEKLFEAFANEGANEELPELDIDELVRLLDEGPANATAI